jgi:hypothetical protein
MLKAYVNEFKHVEFPLEQHGFGLGVRDDILGVIIGYFQLATSI